MILPVDIKRLVPEGYPPVDEAVHVFLTNQTKCLDILLCWDGKIWYSVQLVAGKDEDGKPISTLIKVPAFDENTVKLVYAWCKQIDFFFRPPMGDNQ